MSGVASRDKIRLRIHTRIRKRLSGTSERPRLAVFRSNRHIYAQLIDDSRGETIAAAGSTDSAIRGSRKDAGKVGVAKAVGRLIGERAKDKGVEAVLFDRGGFIYHGRVQALAESAREAGLKF